MDLKTEFVLVRHGQTYGNISRTLQGHSNTDLDATGVKQVKLLGRRLKHHPPFDVIISSDLQRAIDTAKIIIESIGGELISIPELREWNLGLLEGRQWNDLQQEYPDVMSVFRDGGVDVEVPGGERRSVMEKRLADCLDNLAVKYAGQRLLLVTHGGALRAIFRHLVGLPAAGNVFPQISNASYSSCFHSNNTWQVTCWNDTAHLNPEMLNELFTL